MADIFISYSRADKEFAAALAASLSQLEADVWIDVEDISAGEKWSAAIQRALDDCRIMVVIISPESMASRNVEDEWQYYLDNNKPIVPLLLRPAKIHFQLARIQYVDFFNQPYDAALRQLAEQLRRKGTDVTLPTTSSLSTSRPSEPRAQADPKLSTAQTLLSGRRLWSIPLILVAAILVLAVIANLSAARQGGAETPTLLAQQAPESTFTEMSAPTNTLVPTVAAATNATLSPVPTFTPSATPTATTMLLPTLPPSDEPFTLTLVPVDENRFEVGVQVQFSHDYMDMWMDTALNQLGVGWVKYDVRWENVEPIKGQYDFSDLDTYLNLASDYGLKVLISVSAAPDWAREPGVDTSRQGPPANVQDYTDFVRTTLERYPGKVHAVEVWNEMNLDREWTSVHGIRAADYVALLRAAYETIKQLDPGVIVVSGALAPTGFDNGVQSRDDATYIGELVDAGMLNYADCVGAQHNGYNISPNFTYDRVPNDSTALFRGPFDNPHRSWSFRSTLETYAQQIALAGSDLKLCVTEFGWPSSEDIGGYPRGFEFAADNTLEEQAEFTVDALNNMREWGTVRLAFIRNLNYGPQAGYDPNNENVLYSLIGSGATFRPVFTVVRDWLVEHN